MRHLVAEAGLEEQIEVDSAGTAAYHAGEQPDRRSRRAAKQRGIDVSGQARPFVREDWARFDYVLAMDNENYADLRARAPKGAAESKLRMLRSFDSNSGPSDPVPDPYYGGPRGFDEVIDQCEAACRGLLAHIRKEHQI